MNPTAEIWIERRRTLPSYEDERSTRVDALLPALHALESSADVLTRVLHAVMSKPIAVERTRTRAAGVILARATDDLNAMGTLLAEGMPVQAATLAASLWEKAHQANSVVSDERLAALWLESSEDFESYNPVSKTRKHQAAYEVLAKAVGNATPWGKVLSDYRQLCAMKHAHPFVLRNYGLEWGGKSITLSTGPTSGNQSAYVSKGASEAAAGAALWAAVGFASFNQDVLAEGDADRLSESIGEGLAALERLRESYTVAPLDGV